MAKHEDDASRAPRAAGPGIDRRQAMRWLASAALVPLVACESGRGSGADGGGQPTSDAETTMPSEGGTTTRPDGGTTANGEWARGGTAAMTARDAYPDPFTRAVATCSLAATTTQGPCTTASDLAREDVSEGWPGLPVRLALKVVDRACQPVAGATVKIWHTNIEGSYSGQTPNNAACLADQGYASQDFFRGVQTTDTDGVVHFDTCYPGWYPGRAVHIHFQVKSGATSYRVSQLYFSDALSADIFANHPEYMPYGQPNTSLATDNIAGAVASTELAGHVLDVQRMSDGAILASKVIAVV